MASFGYVIIALIFALALTKALAQIIGDKEYRGWFRIIGRDYRDPRGRILWRRDSEPLRYWFMVLLYSSGIIFSVAYILWRLSSIFPNSGY